MPEWALFEVLGYTIAPMKSGHFAGFSKNARIGKPGILWVLGGFIPDFGRFPRIF
jgi:hypothetical protein